jgi:TolB-like protein/predicted Zn-dependent protease
MGADEEGTIARQKVHRAELIDPEITSHGGRIVKTMGDGLLVEFPSVVDAVKCAVAVQRAMSDREADVPEDRRIQYRIGVNLGDIVIDGDDILGDGVNVAARLEGIAEPGGVCVSASVHEQVQSKLDITFADMGAKQVKNIVVPVRAYQVVLSATSENSIGEFVLPEKQSIAVLPFDNMSGDPEQEYFADGIAEDIITSLSRFHWFLVIARNTTFTYKGGVVGVKQVANELGVQYVLEGSVRKASNRVRITAQLIDAQTGSHVWAERYDRDLEDIFAVQDEITEAITGAVAPSFIQAEAHKSERKTPGNLDAWDYAMQGNWHLWRMSSSDITEARRLFEAAIELDPTSAAAYSGLAHAWAIEVYYRPNKDPKSTLDTAFQAAQRAVALDGNDAWAQAVLGLVYAFMRRLDDSVSACRQALALNPSLAFADGVLAICQAFRGEYDEAVVHADRAERLSPRDPQRFLWYQAQAHAALGLAQYEESAMWGKKSIDAYPEFGGGWRILAASYGHLGRIQEAASALQEVRRLYPGATIESMRASHLSNQTQHTERYIEGLRKAGLTEEKEVEDKPPPLPDKPSIAVLPFDNMSGDPEQEYFSDGMAEDLVTDLSKLSHLSVAARNSSFSFKGQMPNISEVAEKLGVAFVLEGSVRKMGDRLRINAQLIDCADGRHIWAERYDGNMAEVFEFQDAIREQIVSALQVSLTAKDRALTERKPTDSVAAYDLFLKGRANFYSATHEHTLEAIKCLEKALEIDPNFADAYGYLSFCQFYGWFHMWPEFDDTLDRAYELAEKGVALDGASAIAVMRLGFTQAWLRRYDQAITNLEKALALAPNNAEVFATFGQALNYGGNPERGLEMVEKALSLETFAPPLWQFYAGTSHFLLHRYDEALTGFNRMAERAPKFSPAHFSLAWAYVELGRLDDARDSIKTALEINSQYTVKEVDRLYPYRLQEVRHRFLDSLRKAGLPEGGEAQDDLPPPRDKPSIAVLPFDNLSNDPEQEYFSDGLAEDLITDLSKISGLFVVARNSAFAFKGQPIDVRRVADELGVRHILEGSVRKAGGRVRINAQLIDAQTGGHIWADRYDGDLEDIFSLQDAITAQIVEALQVTLTPTDKALTERKPTDNVDAYDLFLRGRSNLYLYTLEDLLEAIKYFDKAIEIDPKFADAYGYLSFCHLWGWFQMWPGFDDTFNGANELAEKGVALDDTSAIALTSLGSFQLVLRRYDHSIENFEKALALTPNDAEILARFGQLLNYWGNPEKGLEMLEKALRLETFVPPLWKFFEGHSHLLLGRCEEALSRFLEAVERSPKFTVGHIFLACVYVELDQLEEAKTAIKKALEITPGYSLKEAARILPYRIDQVRNRIFDNLRKAGLPEG